MRTVRINKGELVNKLTENRKNHKAEFDKASVGYRDYMVNELSKAIVRLTSGENIELRFDYDKPPVDHTEDYDAALKMMEMSVDATIELSECDFRQIVLDDWEWQRMWKISNTKYISR